MVNGFLGDDAKRAEVEEAFDIKLSTDETLWEENEFMKYVDEEREWTQTGVDRVTLLGTYLALNYLTKRKAQRYSNPFVTHIV